MSTDLTVPQDLVHPTTGELLPATADNAVEVLQVAREIRSRLMNLVKECEAVILEESRRQGTKTLHLAGGTATVTGGSELVWDVEILDQLRELGLPEERYDELVVATVTYKVDARVAKQLEAANDEYAGVIAAARSYAEKPYRVSVK